MIYLLQTMTYTAILYGLYYLLLRNRATHSWNRKYLLAIAILPTVLPMLQIPGIKYTLPYSSSTFNIILPEVTVIGVKSATFEIMEPGIYAIGYILVSAILLLILLVKLILTRRFLRKLNYKSITDNAMLAMNAGIGPGSFGRYIFFPGPDADNNILMHELAHVQYKHSYDVIFINLLQCIFWPNLLLQLIKKELKIVHEFEADAYAATEQESYINTLLGHILGQRTLHFGHTFFHHPIKRRIIMLQQKQSRSKLRTYSISSGIAALILTTGLVYLQSCHPKMDQKKEVAVNTAEPTNASVENGVYKNVEQMPEPGYDLMVFLSKNIKYPENAKQNKTEGRVVVKFVVDEKGYIQSPEIMRSPDSLLSTEALRVVKLMPPWQPGKDKGKNVPVYFYLPIQFTLG
jgi:TonB family protein